MSRAAGAATAAFVLLALLSPRLQAQEATVTGRVARPGATGDVAVGGARVVLHEVGEERQGPLDSVPSDAAGRFRFRFPVDTSAVYLLSARYHGIEYFSRPLRPDPARPDTGVSLAVYDTSSTAPVGVAARHVVIPRPGEDGTREVIDLVVLRNEGALARVAPDSFGASWSGPLPPESEGLEVGESDVSPDAVERRGDSLFLSAPVGPGEKQLSLQYHLPRGRSSITIPFGAPAAVVNLLVEEPEASVSGAGLAPVDSQLVMGRSFRRWTGPAAAGAVIRVSLPTPGGAGTRVLVPLVVAVAVALALAARRALRPAPAARGAEPAADAARLLERIALLDARYQGREGEVPAEEWSRYLGERARLKTELEAALAAGQAPG